MPHGPNDPPKYIPPHLRKNMGKNVPPNLPKKTGKYVPPQLRNNAPQRSQTTTNSGVHKDDIVKILVSRGWTKGAAGDCYYPSSGYPHLHVKVKTGFHYSKNILPCFEFMVISYGQENKWSTKLLTKGVLAKKNINKMDKQTLESKRMANEVNSLLSLKI